MKIHRLMPVVLVSASVCTALPAFAGSVLLAPDSTSLCGGDSDDDDDDDDDDDKDGETRLCGGDSDDDDGDDSGDDHGAETLQL
jgi:hypothetical protein